MNWWTPDFPQNTTCDGLYCGGPFFQSLLGFILVLILFFAFLGLILSFIGAKP